MPRKRANARIDRGSKPATHRTGLRLLRLAAGAKRGDVTWRLSAPRHENGATLDIVLGSWPAKTLRPDRCRLSAEPTRTGPYEPETGRADHDRRLGRRMGMGDRMHGASGRAHGSAWGPEIGRGSARAHPGLRYRAVSMAAHGRFRGPGSEREKQAGDPRAPKSLSTQPASPLALRRLATQPA